MCRKSGHLTKTHRQKMAGFSVHDCTPSFYKQFEIKIIEVRNEFLHGLTACGADTQVNSEREHIFASVTVETS